MNWYGLFKVALPISYVRCPVCGQVNMCDLDEPIGALSTRKLKHPEHPHRAFIRCTNCKTMLTVSYPNATGSVVKVRNVHEAPATQIEKAIRHNMVMKSFPIDSEELAGVADFAN